MSERKTCPLLTNHAREHGPVGVDLCTVVHCQGENCAWWDPARERCVIYVGMKDLISGMNLIVNTDWRKV